MTLISPAYTREDLIAMIEQRDGLVSALKEEVEKARNQLDNYVWPEPGRLVALAASAAIGSTARTTTEPRTENIGG